MGVSPARCRPFGRHVCSMPPLWVQCWYECARCALRHDTCGCLLDAHTSGIHLQVAANCQHIPCRANYRQFPIKVRFGRGGVGMMHHPMGTTRHAPFGNNPSLQCYNSLRRAGNLHTHPPIRVSLWGGSGAPIKDPSSPQKISHSPCLNHETWKVKMKNNGILNNPSLAGINYYQGRRL